MLTRRELLKNVVEECLKELYSHAQPSVSWDIFIEQNKEYSEQYEEWEKNRDNHPEWKDKPIIECIGPKPYELYYLPRDIANKIIENYVYAYRINRREEFLDTIETLKHYYEDPIKVVYTEENGSSYKDYEHCNNLNTEIANLITKSNLNLNDTDIINLSNKIVNKVFEFLDDAGEFYNSNYELNSFYMSVYLGASPNSNKQAVIDNWKKYRNIDIEIDESKYNDYDF